MDGFDDGGFGGFSDTFADDWSSGYSDPGDSGLSTDVAVSDPDADISDPFSDFYNDQSFMGVDSGWDFADYSGGTDSGLSLGDSQAVDSNGFDSDTYDMLMGTGDWTDPMQEDKSGGFWSGLGEFFGMGNEKGSTPMATQNSPSFGSGSSGGSNLGGISNAIGKLGTSLAGIVQAFHPTQQAKTTTQGIKNSATGSTAASAPVSNNTMLLVGVSILAVVVLMYMPQRRG